MQTIPREVRRRTHDDSGPKFDSVAEPLKSTDYTLGLSYNKTFRMVSPVLLLPMLVVNKKVGVVLPIHEGGWVRMQEKLTQLN